MPTCAAEPVAAAATHADEDIEQHIRRQFDEIWIELLAGKYQEGLARLRPLHDEARQRLGDAAPLTLNLHYYAASTMHRLGQAAEARRSFEDILALHRSAGTMETRPAVRALAALARTVEEHDSDRAALPFYEQAMQARTRVLGDDDLESVTLLDDYANALSAAGRVHEGLALIDRAVDMRTAGLGPEHRWTLTTRGNRAHMYSTIGRHADALEENEAVLRGRRKTLGDDDPTTWSTLSNTAHNLGQLGRHEEAQNIHERLVGLRTATFGPTHFATLSSRRGAAEQLLEMGRPGSAVEALAAMLQESTAAWGPAHRQTRLTSALHVRALEKLGVIDDATQRAGQLHASSVDALGPDHPDSPKAALEHIRLLRRGGRLREAGDLLDRIGDDAARLEGPGMPLGHAPSAERALLAFDRGDFDVAAKQLAALVRISVDPSEDLDPDSDLAPATVARRGLWRRALTMAHARAGNAAQGFAALEEEKASRLLALMGDRKSAIVGGVPADALARIQMLRERVRGLRDVIAQAKHPQDRQALMEESQRSTSELSELKSSLHQRHPLYRRLTRLSFATRRDARLLPRGSVFVSYMVHEDGLLAAFTLDADGTLRWHELGQRAGIAQAVEAFRLWSTRRPARQVVDDTGRAVEIVRWGSHAARRWRVVQSNAAVCIEPGHDPGCRPQGSQTVDSDPERMELGETLARQLIEPMKGTLAKRRRWIVSPDIGLGNLPFDLLPWRASRLAEHVDVSQVQSLSVAKASMQTAARPRRPSRRGQLELLAIGNPVFDDAGAADGTAPHAAPLGAARLEMEGAALAFAPRPSMLISAADASEHGLRALSAQGMLARARHLLASTHATYVPQRPSRSHLRLRGTSRDAQADGIITATDLAGLRLDSALTVLAACSTVRADTPSIDGHFGFAFGLAVAGNRDAVLTLWPVGDLETALFVSRLFTHIARGHPHARALAMTKREFMRHRNPLLRAPRVWAAFVLFGA